MLLQRREDAGHSSYPYVATLLTSLLGSNKFNGNLRFARTARGQRRPEPLRADDGPYIRLRDLEAIEEKAQTVRPKSKRKLAGTSLLDRRVRYLAQVSGGTTALVLFVSGCLRRQRCLPPPEQSHRCAPECSNQYAPRHGVCTEASCREGRRD